jgi:hypothetical protein
MVPRTMNFWQKAGQLIALLALSAVLAAVGTVLIKWSIQALS